ncbi:glycosyltransferase family 2 protein [Aeromonas veronii]
MSLVTVIITVFNGVNTIGEAIDSVLVQTHSNIELIIVDDGSTDGSAQYIKEKFNDKRLRLIENGKVGRSAALNIGIKEAHGDYICILDADDVFQPQKIQIQLLAKSSLLPNAVLFSKASILYGEQKAVKKFVRLTDSKISEVSYQELFKRNPFFHSSLFVRRVDILSVNGYDEKRTRLVDYDLYFRMAKTGCKLFEINDDLICRRVHAGQNFENKKRLNYIASVFKLQIVNIITQNQYQYILHPFAKFVYSLFPERLRYFLRRS